MRIITKDGLKRMLEAAKKGGETRKRRCIENYNKNKKHCKCCNKEILYNKRINNFCNHSCAASYCNKGIVRNGFPSRSCLNCNKKLNNSTRKYCSHACRTSYIWKERKKLIELGKEKSSRACKKYLIEKFGNKCMLCGWNKVNIYSKKVPIELNHIDGNKKNNKLDNLELLCPSCHSLTSTFKGLNIQRK